MAKTPAVSDHLRTWPNASSALIAVQLELAERWQGLGVKTAETFAGCFVCFARGIHGPGDAGDRAWAGAALLHRGSLDASCVVATRAGAPYEPGLLALREGRGLEAALRGLCGDPDCVIVNATGRDHPRRAGLALQLGAVLGVPTIGVTHRPLVASGPQPPRRRGATAPLWLDGEQVGFWLCTRSGSAPLAVSAGWQTGPDTAAELALAAAWRVRTPAPLRYARGLARRARAGNQPRR